MLLYEGEFGRYPEVVILLLDCLLPLENGLRAGEAIGAFISNEIDIQEDNRNLPDLIEVPAGENTVGKLVEVLSPRRILSDSYTFPCVFRLILPGNPKIICH